MLTNMTNHSLPDILFNICDDMVVCFHLPMKSDPFNNQVAILIPTYLLLHLIHFYMIKFVCDLQ